MVEVSASPEKIAEMLTMAGLEVDAISEVGTDVVIDIDLTPNRADCTSLLGIAQEIGALSKVPFSLPEVAFVPPTTEDKIAVSIEAKKACHHYASRVLSGLDNTKPTPEWLKARLEACGARSIDPIVDVLNYVMFAIGQPMHAFDKDKLTNTITVALLDKLGTLTVIDESEKKLSPNTLVIKDDNAIQAVAGIMGGKSSSVSSATTTVVLESAYFTPQSVAGKSTEYNLHTESSYRFERGIHPARQIMAIEMATALILEICGGACGPTISTRATDVAEPQPEVILLRHARVEKLLGITVSAADIEDILTRLGGACKPVEGGWEVTAPLARQDWKIEADLIEEVARLIGYHNIPAQLPRPALSFPPAPEKQVKEHRLKQLLADIGYQEIISYSFVDPQIQSKLLPKHDAVPLLNPISADKAHMRLSCWPGLLSVIGFHQRRQYAGMKIFEVGQVFEMNNGNIDQKSVIAGALFGNPEGDSWANSKQAPDFYDIKHPCSQLLKYYGLDSKVRYTPAEHPSLHPGQCAEISIDGKTIGYLGRLHPSLQKPLDLQGPIYLFEMDIKALSVPSLPKAPTLSKFPSARRDIALLVNKDILAQDLIDALQGTVSDLSDCWVFDVYEGKGVPEGKKSLAIGLILQDISRTLLEEEVDSSINEAVQLLEKNFGAKLRE